MAGVKWLANSSAQQNICLRRLNIRLRVWEFKNWTLFFQTLFWFLSDLRKYFHWSRGGISLVKSLKSSPGRTKRGSCHFYSSAHKTGSTCFSWKHLNEMKTKNSAADNTKHVFIETFKVDDLYLSSFARYCQFNCKQNRLIIQYKYTCAKNQIFNLKSLVELSTHLFCQVLPF